MFFLLPESGGSQGPCFSGGMTLLIHADGSQDHFLTAPLLATVVAHLARLDAAGCLQLVAAGAAPTVQDQDQERNPPPVDLQPSSFSQLLFWGSLRWQTLYCRGHSRPESGLGLGCWP